MTQILKVLQLAQKYGVAKVEIRSCRVETSLDAQGTARFRRLHQAHVQIFLTDEISETLLEVGELFGYGSEGHFTIVNVKTVILTFSLVSTMAAQSLTDRYFDEYYFPFNPTSATSAGIHRYDD